jgi:peptidoglycan/xylan/chitin deacetylase (PgdA/CDA1 family)
LKIQMRPSVIIARAATRVAWPLTRLDRNGDLSGPVVLCYHRVLPRSSAAAPPPAYAVTPEQFRNQMSLLAREGFTSLTLKEFSEAARGARALPPRSALITFDDGFIDNYLLAWPIAREFAIKLNLFLCTSLLAREQVEAFSRPSVADGANRKEFPHLWQPLTWAQVREMGAAEVGVGFHSHTHRNLGKLSSAEITEDAAKGLALFAAELGVAPECFAFPYGHYGSYSEEAISALKEQGLEMFFTTELGRTPPHSVKPISRIVVHPEDDMQSFRRKLYGGYDWVGKLRQAGYSFAGRLSRDSLVRRSL